MTITDQTKLTVVPLPEALSQSLPGAVLGQAPHDYGVGGGQGTRAAGAAAPAAARVTAGQAAGARAAHRAAAHQRAAHADPSRSAAAADGSHASGT